jgi:lysophospholipase L1-like esterase
MPASALRDLRDVPGALLASPVIGICVALALALAWNDVLPGGFRLRRLVEPHQVQVRRAQAHARFERLAEFERENPRVAPGAIAFLGSSTIERFPLADCFPGRPCLGRGIGNESAAELLERLEASLPPVALGGVVLATGRVDFLAGADAAALRARVEAVVRRLAELRPGVPIALLGLLPERDQSAEVRARLARANAALAELAAAPGLAFVPTARAPLTRPDGALAEDVSVDRLHLGASGYRHLSRWIVADGGAVGERLAP